MGTKPAGVLTPDDLNETDVRVLDVLHGGRSTPQYVAEELDVSRTYASERLKRLVEHGHVDRLASGLYELADDPRETTDDSTPDETAANAIARQHELEMQLEECRDELAARPDVDVKALERALDDIEAAATNGDGNGLQDALRRAREAIDDA